MASFEKIDRMNVKFDKNDLTEVNISAGSYSGNIYLTTRNGQTVELKFDNTADLKEFVEVVTTLGLKMEWEANYPGAYMTQFDSRVTVEDIARWKEHYTENPPTDVPF